jgi:hypothetical protein
VHERDSVVLVNNVEEGVERAVDVYLAKVPPSKSARFKALAARRRDSGTASRVEEVKKVLAESSKMREVQLDPGECGSREVVVASQLALTLLGSSPSSLLAQDRHRSRHPASGSVRRRDQDDGMEGSEHVYNEDDGREGRAVRERPFEKSLTRVSLFFPSFELRIFPYDFFKV